MPGRHEASSGRRPRLRWLVGLAGGAVVGATLLAFSPAGAASTVHAQLSLTGVATSTSVLGGSDIGVHPGDTVVFKASAVPTAGLENIPTLGSVLTDLLSTALGQYQVVVSFGGSFPGGAKTVTLGGPTTGKCAGVASESFTFPDKGSYNFTWKVQYVLPTLLGCVKNGVSDANLNLLEKAGVALNATNSWVGKVVVADNPPPGGISIQLPGVSVAPSLPGVGQLPTIGVPGVTLPTIGVPVPNLTASTPAGGSGSSGGNGNGGNGSTPAAEPTNEIPVPAKVVPGINGGGLLGSGGGYTGVLPGGTGNSQLGAGALQPVVSPSSGSVATGTTNQSSTGKHKTIDLASSKASTGQLSVVLAIIAIIALTLVAATYARLYVLRR
jgi:hypothetical protein